MHADVSIQKDIDNFFLLLVSTQETAMVASISKDIEGGKVALTVYLSLKMY